MYAQLGNIVFEGLNGLESYSSTDTTTYAQHDIIGGKPVLVPTGNDVEEISLSLRLRAEYIKPEQAILELKKSKDNYEVLPLVKGNGRYLGDYVIVSLSVSDVQALADGTTVEATVELTLKEYQVADKLQQQQSAARKQAFATGEKKPVNVAIEQPATIAQQAAADLTVAEGSMSEAAAKAKQYRDNVSRRAYLEASIKKDLKNAEKKLDAFKEKLDKVQDVADVVKNDIVRVVTAVKSQIGYFTFPITSIDDLNLNANNLQDIARSLGRTADPLNILIMTRKI